MRKVLMKKWIRVLFILGVWTLWILLTVASGQEDVRPESERWMDGDFAEGDMESAAYQQKTWAIPGLEKAFAKESNPWKRFVASAVLVELGSTDQRYWDHMEAVVRQAMSYRGPNPIMRSESGRMLDGRLSNEFITWCAERSVDPVEYYGMVMMHEEGRVFTLLAFWQDRRLIPLLREALQSNNPYVVNAAGMGLGNRDDTQGLEVVVARYRALGLVTNEYVGALARVLSRFKQSKIRDIPEQWRQEHQEALAEAEQSRPDAYKLQ